MAMEMHIFSEWGPNSPQDHAKSFCAVVLYPFEPERGAALVADSELQCCAKFAEVSYLEVLAILKPS